MDGFRMTSPMKSPNKSPFLMGKSTIHSHFQWIQYNLVGPLVVQLSSLKKVELGISTQDQYAAAKHYPNITMENHGKSPSLLGKSSISMTIFNSYVTNYQRLSNLNH